jgi:hypothetical protein
MHISTHKFDQVIIRHLMLVANDCKLKGEIVANCTLVEFLHLWFQRRQACFSRGALNPYDKTFQSLFLKRIDKETVPPMHKLRRLK